MLTVILAGGLGSRMRPATERVPKALIEVLGRPFAAWQLELVAREGIREVLYSVGHLGQQIEAYVGDGAAWGLSVRYSYERDGLLGTGGALRLALDRGLLEDPFFVMYGDSYLPTRFDIIADSFFRSSRPALMTIFRNEGRWERGNVSFVDGCVTMYDKRSVAVDSPLHYVDYGLSVLQPSIVADLIPPAVSADLSDTYHALSLAGQLAGHEVHDRFYEIGSPSGLADLENLLRQPKARIR